MKTSLIRSSLCFLLSLFFAIGAVDAAHGADAVSFNPVPVLIEASAAGGGVPVGTVVAWPVAENPSDADSWLECNGQSTNGYPELAALVGANVPDLQGKFLRGLGGNSAGLGVAQEDAIRNINASLAAGPYEFLSDGPVTATGAFRVGTTRTGGVIYNGDTWYPGAPTSIIFDASRSVPTANENRPANMAVRYLIRARP